MNSPIRAARLSSSRLRVARVGETNSRMKKSSSPIKGVEILTGPWDSPVTAILRRLPEDPGDDLTQIITSKLSARRLSFGAWFDNDAEAA